MSFPSFLIAKSDKQFLIDPTHLEVADGAAVLSPQKADHEYIDMTDIGWMNKSTIDILLRAGQVDEDQTMVAVGGRAVSLPIVKIRDKMTDNDFRVLKKAKDLEFDTDSSAEFAKRVQRGRTKTDET